MPALVEVNLGTEEDPFIVPTAFYAVVSVAVIGLYLAFLIPIWLRWRMGDAFEPGSWNNGSKYKWMNLIAVAEIVIISVYFILPFVPQGNPLNDDFSWKFVNYAPILTIGALVILCGLVGRVRQELVHRAAAHDRPGRGRGLRRLSGGPGRRPGPPRRTGGAVLAGCGSAGRADQPQRPGHHHRLR